MKIEKEKHIGVIKDVQCVFMKWYLYTIKTFPVEWLCFVDEKEIVEKLSDEQIEAEKKKNKII